MKINLFLCLKKESKFIIHNHYYTPKMKKILSVLLLIIASVTLTLHAQTSIDINSSGAKTLQAEESVNPVIREIFKDVDRYRTFNYNQQLASLRSDNVGDTLLLNFFDNKQYKAVIQRVSLTYEGRTSIVSTIVGAEFAYCYIIVSENTITISGEIPFENEYFFASVKGGEAYIGQMRRSEMNKDALEDSEPLTNPNFNQKYAKP